MFYGIRQQFHVIAVLTFVRTSSPTFQEGHSCFFFFHCNNNNNNSNVSINRTIKFTILYVPQIATVLIQAGQLILETDNTERNTLHVNSSTGILFFLRRLKLQLKVYTTNYVHCIRLKAFMKIDRYKILGNCQPSYSYLQVMSKN